MQFEIGKKTIGGESTYVIAEVGNNHNGDLALAIEMVDQAKDCGADCVKFQMRNLDEVYREQTLSGLSEDLGTEYVVDLLKRFELSEPEHRTLFSYCNDKAIEYLCTPWDERSAGILNDFGVAAFKVASADLTNIPLLECLIGYRKPLLISTGMSSWSEIEITVNFLREKKASFALLHCNSTYPAPLQDINLKGMLELRKLHELIGYSGHERGINVSLAAVALGACVIERHFTVDRSMEGPDHAASLTKAEFFNLVNGIREIELAKGNSNPREISQGEMINRENLGKSLVASRAMPKGHLITKADIKVRSPGQGLSPQKLPELIGRKLDREMRKEDFFYPSDLGGALKTKMEYKFQRPWGIPVRYHDFSEFRKIIKPNFWEFHLSYKDMDLDPSKFIDGSFEENYVVHAPELFAGSHLMDLASVDQLYRERSITETQRVISITKELKRFFPNCDRPKIVANVGGFSMDSPIKLEDLNERYEIFSESIKCLDLDEVELIPQTMAPFPWHFGGQRYQNLFIRIDEIERWCDKLKLRMCFDVSHSKLAANHFGFDFYDFAKRIAPYTAHIHLGDAKGLNGEGLQVGSGEINFGRLGYILAEQCVGVSFIPEIWQGHKDRGVGFWTALERLEGIF
jgi:sialic acid synthase SpsE/sugar phosphate isomerase/epimerase